MSSPKLIPPLVALVLLLGPGCRERPEGPQARPVPRRVDEGGWPLYEQPADGFALALPPGWTALALDPKTIDQTMEQGIRANPSLKAMEQGIRQQAAAGLKFLGAERAGSGPNVNVFKLPLVREATLDAAGADWAKQFEAMPSVERPITRRQVRLRAGEAERFDYVIPATLPNGKRERLALTSYLQVRGRELYAVTTTVKVDEVVRYAPTFDRIVGSFRFLGK